LAEKFAESGAIERPKTKKIVSISLPPSPNVHFISGGYRVHWAWTQGSPQRNAVGYHYQKLRLKMKTFGKNQRLTDTSVHQYYRPIIDLLKISQYRYANLNFSMIRDTR